MLNLWRFRLALSKISSPHVGWLGLTCPSIIVQLLLFSQSCSDSLLFSLVFYNVKIVIYIACVFVIYYINLMVVRTGDISIYICDRKYFAFSILFWKWTCCRCVEWRWNNMTNPHHVLNDQQHHGIVSSTPGEQPYITWT